MNIIRLLTMTLLFLYSIQSPIFSCGPDANDSENLPEEIVTIKTVAEQGDVGVGNIILGHIITVERG